MTRQRRPRRPLLAALWIGFIAGITGGACGTANSEPAPPPGPGGGFGSGWVQCGDQMVPTDPRVDMSKNPLGGLIYREMSRQMCGNEAPQ